MTEPTFDENGYPTEEALETIKQWNIYPDLKGLLLFAEEAFTHRYGHWEQIGTTLRVATMGWSGCESVIDALADNFIFWTTCWILSKRGGLFLFDVSESDKRHD